MIYYVGVSLDRYGADDGLTIYRRSQFAGLINLSNKTLFYYLCLALLLATVYLVWRIVNSRFGLVIQGARSNDRRMHAIGFPDLSLQAHLFRHRRHAVRLVGRAARQPDRFRQPGDDALDALRRSHRDGRCSAAWASSFGPVIGAVALLVLEEVLSHLIGVVGQVFTGREVAAAREYWQIILGPMLLLVVLFARGGIDGLLAEPAPWLSRCSQIDGLTKRFGGVVASDDITLDVSVGRAARRHRPERRRQDHADRPAHRRNRAQCRPHPFRRRTTSRRCRPTSAARAGWRARSRSRRCFSTSPRSTMSRWPCRRMPVIRSASGAMRAASRTCASRRARRSPRRACSTAPTLLVSKLSHGEHRQLEIAMALATRPRLLLLDEPMAGMGPEESARMVKTLRELKQELHHPADRARHGGGVRARRPHHRAGLWPRHRHRARRPTSAPMPRCGRPISASRRSSGAWLMTCSTSPASRPATALSQVLFGVSLAIERGRDGDADGPQRHGQDHDGALDHGADARPWRARSASTARKSARCRPIASPSSASASCRRAGRCFPISPRARICVATAANRRRGRRPVDAGQGLRAVSAAGRAARQHGQPALRRRAADAGDRPRADDQSAPAHSRRGDRRAGAAHPRRNLAMPDRG